MATGNTVNVKSRFGEDLRRFTVQRDLDDYQSFVHLVLEAHHLPLQADVALFFQDPASLSDMLPLQDTPSLCRALQSVSSAPLRIVVQLRSGLWERESSGEEEDHSSDGDSSLSNSPPHSPTPHAPPSSSPSLPLAPNQHSSQHIGSSDMSRTDMRRECQPSPHRECQPSPHRECQPSPHHLLCGESNGLSGNVPVLPPHPLLLMFAERQAKEGLFSLATMCKDEASLPTQLSQLTLQDPDPPSSLNSDHHSEDRFPYVIEIYDFDPQLTTRDIIREMHRKYSPNEFRLKWVDDTHALGIFASDRQAWLSAKAPFHQFKTRLLKDGTKQSKSVADRLAEELRPCGSASRPKTTALVARRLVARTLGVQLSQEQREREKVQRIELQMARAQKRAEVQV